MIEATVSTVRDGFSYERARQSTDSFLHMSEWLKACVAGLLEESQTQELQIKIKRT